MGPKKRKVIEVAAHPKSPAQKSAKKIARKYRGKRMTPEKAANVRRALESVATEEANGSVAATSHSTTAPSTSRRPGTIVIDNSVIKGYHVYKIKPPVTDTYFLIDREYTNLVDKNACLVWIPDISKFNISLHEMVTDEKRNLKLSDIAGLPVGHVPGTLSGCFCRILDSGGHIYAIVKGDPCPSFPPWPAPHEKGGGVVIPCRYVVVDDAESTFAHLTEALSDMVEGNAMQISIM